MIFICFYCRLFLMRVTRTWFLVDDETRKKGRESWKERKGYKDGLVIWEREEVTGRETSHYS